MVKTARACARACASSDLAVLMTVSRVQAMELDDAGLEPVMREACIAPSAARWVGPLVLTIALDEEKTLSTIIVISIINPLVLAPRNRERSTRSRGRREVQGTLYAVIHIRFQASTSHHVPTQIPKHLKHLKHPIHLHSLIINPSSFVDLDS